MSKQVVVPKKFRKRVLDPDERYEQERARMEAAKVQRAAQVRIWTLSVADTSSLPMAGQSMLK